MKFWKNWPYWMRGMLCGIIVAILIIFLVEKTDLFVYSFRQQHPYLAGIHRIIATSPSYLGLVLTPTFCKPTEAEPLGVKDCWGIFLLISYTIEFFEIIFIGALGGWLYGKIKNRKLAS